MLWPGINGCPILVELKLGIATWINKGFPVETVMVEGWVISGFVARLVELA
jgi:hypothetical protein